VKWIVIITVAMFGVFALPQNSELLSEKERVEITQQMTGIEKAWTQMLVTRDFSGLDKMLASDYVGADHISTRTKAKEIASYSATPKRSHRRQLRN